MSERHRYWATTLFAIVAITAAVGAYFTYRNLALQKSIIAARHMQAYRSLTGNNVSRIECTLTSPFDGIHSTSPIDYSRMPELGVVLKNTLCDSSESVRYDDRALKWLEDFHSRPVYIRYEAFDENGVKCGEMTLVLGLGSAITGVPGQSCVEWNRTDFESIARAITDYSSLRGPRTK